MKEKIKGLFDSFVKPALLGFVAIVIIFTVLSIPELAGTIGAIIFSWVIGKLIVTGYKLSKEEW